MYSLIQNTKGSHDLMRDEIKVGEFYCRATGDLVCNLLNVTNAHIARSSRVQAG
jgi:hypothetical protein